MANSNGTDLSALSHLYRMVEAGERGFATAAAGTSNQGLKLLLKSYAQQRFQFKEEIDNLIKAAGGSISARPNLPGMVHRGRIAIFAAMTIEDDKRERMVLKESALGERYALRAYEQTLESDLPAETRQVIERQLAEVREVRDNISLMLGKEQKQQVVRLFSSAPDANLALEALEEAGFPQDEVKKVVPDQSIDEYHGRRATVRETALAGMVGGMVWGTLIGILAGFGAETTTALAWMGINTALATFAVVALIVIAMGALVGGVLGLAIGLGTSEEDNVDYREGTRQGSVILCGTVDANRAQEAVKIMDQVNLKFSKSSARTST